MTQYARYPALGGGGGGSGTVTSVGLAAPASILTVSGSPVTTSGTLTLSLATQNANKVWAGPTTGADATPTFRALVAADIPAGLGYLTSINTDTTAAQLLTVGTSGTDFAIANPGSGSHVFNLPTASASNRGALSSTDWSTFNSKQAAGNYITALTGDVSASGPGSAAATLATVNSNIGSFASVTVNAKGLVTAAAALSGDATTSGAALTLATVNSNVGSFTNASITVNAKGLVTAASSGTAAVTTIGAFGSTPNSGGASISGATLTLQPADGTNPGGVSTTTQTIAGAKTFSSAVSVIAGAVGAVSINSGTAGTGIWFPTAASIMAYSSGGAEVWRTNANGITIGNTTAQTKSLYIKPTASSIGIQLENSANTRKFNIDTSTLAGQTLLGMDGTTGPIGISNVASGGTGVNWIGICPEGAGTTSYPKYFNTVSGSGNVTAISSIIPNNGASINDAPWVVNINANNTANTLCGWVTAGNSKNPMSFIGTQHKTQTTSSEVSDLWFATQKAGTLTLGLKLTDQGQLAVQQASAGISIKEGSNCKQGVATLVAGTVVVNNTSVTTSSRILLTAQSLGTILVPAALAVSARTASTSFTILSSDVTDTSVVAYEIFEPS